MSPEATMGHLPRLMWDVQCCQRVLKRIADHPESLLPAKFAAVTSDEPASAAQVSHLSHAYRVCETSTGGSMRATQTVLTWTAAGVLALGTATGCNWVEKNPRTAGTVGGAAAGAAVGAS